MDMEEKSALQHHPLFEGIEPEGLGRLLGGARPREYAKGEMLFHRGDGADCFYFIFDGWVKVYRDTPDGAEAVLGVFTNGESIGDAVAFNGGEYPANAQAVTQSRLLPIRAQPFIHEVQRAPDVGLRIIASMSKRMHTLILEVERLKTQTATQRVCEFLLRRCTVDEGSAVVALPYDKTVISARLGMKPESLSRILARLRKHGVRTDKNRVSIADVATLSRFCEGEGFYPSTRSLGA